MKKIYFWLACLLFGITITVISSCSKPKEDNHSRRWEMEINFEDFDPGDKFIVSEKGVPGVWVYHIVQNGWWRFQIDTHTERPELTMKVVNHLGDTTETEVLIIKQ